MRIERITIDLCVSDHMKRSDIAVQVSECLKLAHGILVTEFVDHRDKEAEFEAACRKVPQLKIAKKPEQTCNTEPKPKRKYTKRSAKWTAANTESTNGEVKRTVRTNANGETETVRDGEQDGEKIIFRK